MRRKNKILLFFFGISALSLCLNLWQLGKIPISLHGDEVGVGYNAYSLLKSGIDEYGKTWPLILRADVSPLIFYSTVPAIALLGLNDFTVRFPSVIVSMLSLAIIFLFISELFDSNNIIISKHPYKIALLCTTLIAFSPWHIQFSRIAHDAIYGLVLQFLGMWTFLLGIRKSNRFAVSMSFLIMGSTFYAYHAPRLTSPILLLLLIYHCRHFFYKKILYLIFCCLIFIIVTLPIVFDFFSKPLAQTRFGGINIFVREKEEKSLSIPKIFFKFSLNYINQFNPHNLFFDTSTMRYFQVQDIGLLFVIEFPFLLIGMYTLWKLRSLKSFIFLWILIAPLPGALTVGPPNAGRILLLLPVLQLVISLGLLYFLKMINRRPILRYLYSLICGLFALNLIYFSNQYFINSPIRFYDSWEYGVKELAVEANKYETSVDKIIISQNIKQAYIYVLLYNKKDPLWLKNQLKKRNSFIGFNAFGKYDFTGQNWNSISHQQNTLYIGPPAEFPFDVKTNFVIYSPSHKVLYMGVKT